MHRIRLRFALPCALTLIDVVLLLACIYNAHIDAREANVPFAWVNDGDNPWATFEYYTPKPLAAFDYGTLPVSYLATSIFPKWIEHHPFDRAWAGLHLALGIAFWYALGRFGETKKWLRVGLLFYVVFRAVTLPLSLSPGPSDSRLDTAYILMWFAAVLLGFAAIIISLLRKARVVFAGRRSREADKASNKPQHQRVNEVGTHPRASLDLLVRA